MIPKFPNFAGVTVEHKQQIEEFTHRFVPYSDFNFVSLYSWDTEGKRQISTFDGGLVVVMTDYETGERLLSFLGEFTSRESVATLLEYANESGYGNALHYIGESSIEKIDLKDYSTEEDAGNFDYIVSITDIASMKGRSFASKRHLANKFETRYSNVEFKQLQLMNTHLETHVMPILTSEKNPDHHEHEAIKRLVTDITDENLLLSTVFVNGEFAGFSIDEILPMNYAISHFYKCNYAFKGIAEYMNREVARHLLSKGATLWNWEQDLGLNKLKKMKNGYRPVKLLKKYKISMK